MITLNNKQICENCFSEVSSEPCPYCGFVKNEYRHDPITLAVGSVLNQRYMIGGVIGKGGFGITYLAYDLKLDARLAVKEYYPMGLAVRAPGSTLVSISNEESAEPFRTGAEKFYNEAKMVAKFNGNPNIVSVHDFFYENDTVYFTMGYLQGETLKTYLKKKKVSEGQAINIFQSISSALLASHSLNILHRDISPDNIMLCDDETIRLLDFGAARQVMAEQSQSLSVILKQGFAPLEQYQKKGNQGPWTDIYALGATVYTALTGEMLNDPMTRLEDDTEFASNKHGISEALWNVIQKCTQLKIQDRYQDIHELKRDLNAIGIESEAFPDVEVEIKDVLKKGARPFGSTTGTGLMSQFAPTGMDPNATMYLGAENPAGADTSVNPNAMGVSGGQIGRSSNETVALTSEQAAAYAEGKGLQPPQPGWGSTVNMPQMPVGGGYTGQPPAGAGQSGMPGQYPQGQPQQTPPAKKGIPIPAVIAIAVLALGIFIFAGVKVIKALTGVNTSDTEDSTEASDAGGTEDDDNDNDDDDDDTDTSDDSGAEAGDEADGLRSAGAKKVKKYSNDTFKYSICYPSGYKVSDADEKTVEISNKAGTLHTAVRFMDRYIDGSILYDAQDLSNMINVRPDNLLPVEGSGDTPDVDDAGKIDFAGEEDISHFEYHYEDKKEKEWNGNVYIFDSKGQYGCYVVYTLVDGEADDQEELQEYAKACADSFRVDEKYDPPKVEIFDQNKYGIKFSVTDGKDFEQNQSDALEVHFENDGSDHKAWIVPGDNYGSELSEIFVNVVNNAGQTEISVTSDMIPLDFGEYKGYRVSATIDGQPGTMYGFSTNFGSDAMYQSYVIVGYDSDEDQLKELVGGFRFEGATTYDNLSVDPRQTVPLSTQASSDGNMQGGNTPGGSEYIFPGTDSRQLTMTDIDAFLRGYLDSNNANNLSEAEKRRICARGLCYARNEIYARHGYIFNTSELRQLFNSMSWYREEIPSDRFSNSMLNSAEKKNVELLKAVMDDYGGYKPAQ